MFQNVSNIETAESPSINEQWSAQLSLFTLPHHFLFLQWNSRTTGFILFLEKNMRLIIQRLIFSDARIPNDVTGTISLVTRFIRKYPRFCSVPSLFLFSRRPLRLEFTDLSELFVRHCQEFLRATLCTRLSPSHVNAWARRTSKSIHANGRHNKYCRSQALYVCPLRSRIFTVRNYNCNDATDSPVAGVRKHRRVRVSSFCIIGFLPTHQKQLFV